MSEALEALLDYRQSDDDGVAVEVSRQAIHEVADKIKSLEARNDRLLKALRDLADEIANDEEHGDGADDEGCTICCAHKSAREAIATEEKEQSK